MDRTTDRTNPRADSRAAAPAGGQLARLEDLDDYQVADGEPDPRGWDVKTADGKTVGKVDSLVADTAAMQIRYLDVELDRKALSLREDRHVLVPVSGARLNDDDDNVLLVGTTAAQLVALPPYTAGSTTAPAATPGARVPNDGDMQQFYGRRGGTGNVQRLTLSEEQVRVGKRATEAGDVTLHKTVETEHVSKEIPLRHEEVTVERRPIAAGAPAGKISEDEIRIPLMAEEAVVEKRTVAAEEIVVRKKVVTENETVEADVRKERLATDDVDVKRSARGTPGRDADTRR